MDMNSVETSGQAGLPGRRLLSKNLSVQAVAEGQLEVRQIKPIESILIKIINKNQSFK